MSLYANLRIGRAAALVKAGRADEALSSLDAIDESRIAAHQPYWATRAHALAALNRRDEARAAFDLALGLTDDPAARAFLRAQADRL